MKKAMHFVVRWKTGAALMFTSAVVIYLVFCWIFGEEAAPVRILWSLLLVSLAGSFLQGLCFSQWVFRRLRYSLRLALFVLVYLPLLSAVAWRFQWFPVEYAGSWAIFTGTFLAILILTTAGFEIYFRITGKRYDGLLGQYRRQKEEG